MGWSNPSNEEIRQILHSSNTIAVVGLSDNPDRTSYQISKAMKNAGYRIIPVNPNADRILGEISYPSLLDIPDKIDIINVFRRAEFLPQIAEDAIQTDCRIFWSQQGIINEKAYYQLKDEQFTVIMDLCIKVAQAVLK